MAEHDAARRYEKIWPIFQRLGGDTEEMRHRCRLCAGWLIQPKKKDSKRTRANKDELEDVAAAVDELLAALDRLSPEARAYLAPHAGENDWLYRLVPGNARRRELERYAERAREPRATGPRRTTRHNAIEFAWDAWMLATNKRRSYTTPIDGGPIGGEFVQFVTAIFAALKMPKPKREEIRRAVPKLRPETLS